MYWRLAVILLVVAGAAPAVGAGTELAVMTFNLRYGTAEDGENAWPQRKDILVNAIRQAAPDILGAQECLQFQAEYIATALPDYHWIGIGREADGGGEMTAVFYRKSLLNPIESGHFWLSETPDVPGSKSWGTICTRMATWVRFWHRKTGAFFYLFNTHFDFGSEEARERSAALLAGRAVRAAADLPVILTGDFNADAEETRPWQVFIDQGFVDAWRAAEKRTGPEYTLGNFAAPPKDAKSRIDWILVRGPVTVHSCETVLHNEGGRYPSDHYPVTARFTLNR